MGAIYRREMGAFFTSGIGYVFLTVFYIASGYFFYNDVIKSGLSDISPMFVSMFIVVIFLIPVLTMRLISEEKKNRTDQGLLTAPIGLWELVLGKFFAAFTLYVIAESVIFIYALILKFLSDDMVWSSLLGNYFAMLILGAAFIAIGVFISSLTENQMSSAVVSVFFFLVLYAFDDSALEKLNSNSIISKVFSVDTREKMMNFLSHLSMRARYTEFTRGVFSLSSVLFFLSIVFLFNFFTVKVLEKKRWA